MASGHAFTCRCEGCARRALAIQRIAAGLDLPPAVLGFTRWADIWASRDRENATSLLVDSDSQFVPDPAEPVDELTARFQGLEID